MSWNRQIELAWQALHAGAPARARDLIEQALVDDPNAADAHAALGLLAQAYLSMGEHALSADAYWRLLQSGKADSSVLLDLAAVLIDAGEYADAENVAREAVRAGADQGNAFHILGRALQAQNLLEDAESAFRSALSHAPDAPPVHYDLAQLVWTRTGDLAAASAEIDARLDLDPRATPLRTIKAMLCGYAGDSAAAYAVLSEGLAHAPRDARLHLAASKAALKFDAPRAADHAAKALALAPDNRRMLIASATALIAVGRVEEAGALTARLLATHPLDQKGLALQATVWRLLDDPRYRDVYDYEQFVRGWTIDVPKGWTDLPSYLGDLATSLRALHSGQAAPIGQSLRQGTQTRQNLLHSRDPVIRAFFEAIDAPIRRHMQALGSGSDAMRSRNTGRYRIVEAWSIQLSASGYHVDHIHPQGWLSSACYIHLPRTIASSSQEGWIKFGEPGIPLKNALPADHRVQPQPGLLVLFPSYLWHGTVPFAGEPGDTRLTIAFDVVPA